MFSRLDYYMFPSCLNAEEPRVNVFFYQMIFHLLLSVFIKFA